MARTLNTVPVSRSTAWIGGISLLLIAILAGVGYFGALAPLITAGDASQTAVDIAGSETRFRLGVLCMMLAALLDIVVAAALLSLLEPVNRMLAVTAAWFRIAYTAVFVVAIAQLATAPNLLDTPELALNAIESYNTIWRTGLILFGAHLLFVGYLAFRSGFMPRALGILIAIAGMGYIADGIGTILIPDYVATISSITFIGEVALIGWLLWMAIRRQPSLMTTPQAPESIAHG